MRDYLNIWLEIRIVNRKKAPKCKPCHTVCKGRRDEILRIVLKEFSFWILGVS